MTQTVGKTQVYDVVPIGFPNAGKSSYRNITQSEMEASIALFNAELVRAVKVVTQNASAGNSINTQSARTFVFKMNQNLTNLLLSNGAFDGQCLVLIFDQDATGNRVMTFDLSKVEGSLDVGVPTLYGTANTRDIIPLIWDAVKTKWSLLPNIRRIP